MPLKLNLGWTKIAALFLFGGALAWTLKLAVIISTNGRSINTGAAALFMTMGLILLLIGSTGIGYQLTRNRPLWLRIIAMLLSPVIVFGSFLVVGMITGPLFKDSGVWYAQEEGPIGFAVVISLALGYFLYRSRRPVILS